MSGKKIALVLGIVFLLVGILGFVPNGIVGADGYFVTNGLHDLVHLVTGLILVFVGLKSAGSAPMVMKVLGVVYLLVALLGFFMSTDGMFLGLSVNGADNVLHVILGVVLLWAGFAAGKRTMAMPSSGMGM